MYAGFWKADWFLGVAVVAGLALVGAALAIRRVLLHRARLEFASQIDGAEANRLLGLAYHAQGDLDRAWDRLRRAERSEPLLENLYYLGVDLQKKRHFVTAEAVFNHLQGMQPGYRDVGEKIAIVRDLAEAAAKTKSLRAAAEAAAAAAAIVAAPAKPRFGHFELEREIGRGTLGVVHLGTDLKMGREVALKTLALAEHFDAADIADVKERFFQEMQAAVRLAHKDIATIYDVGDQGDTCYVAMELAPGTSLAPFTKAALRLPADTVVSLVARAAEALGYAHREGVLHGDVKPTNLIYDAASDSLKLADFGLARVGAAAKSRRGTQRKPSYQAPEQLARRAVDGRADLFSLAVLLYQLLSARLPFEADSAEQVSVRIANDPPADIRAFADVSAGLVSFLERALAKEPADRFQTGEHFGGALRAAVAGAVAQPAAIGNPAGGIDLKT